MITSNKRNINQQSFDENFITCELLGYGAYSKVVSAIEIISGKKYAIKIINSMYHNSKVKNKYLKRELDVLENIFHNNIIKYYNTGTFLIDNKQSLEPHDCIILEFAENGSLFEYIINEKRGFNEQISRVIFLQIINGLEKCHDEGIAHGDLKTENILFQNDWTIKLCDFGNSYKLDSKNVDLKDGTTKQYCAPEIYHGDKNEIIDAKADIFSLGVILFIIVVGNFPFMDTSNTDYFYRRIKVKKFNGIWEQYKERIPSFESLNISNEFKDLFTSLVLSDPKDRPTIEEIKKSKWLNSDFASLNDVTTELEKRKRKIRKV